MNFHSHILQSRNHPPTYFSVRGTKRRKSCCFLDWIHMVFHGLRLLFVYEIAVMIHLAPTNWALEIVSRYFSLFYKNALSYSFSKYECKNSILINNFRFILFLFYTFIIDVQEVKCNKDKFYMTMLLALVLSFIVFVYMMSDCKLYCTNFTSVDTNILDRESDILINIRLK